MALFFMVAWLRPVTIAEVGRWVGWVFNAWSWFGLCADGEKATLTGDFRRLYPHIHHTDGFFAAVLVGGVAQE